MDPPHKKKYDFMVIKFCCQLEIHKISEKLVPVKVLPN